MKYYLLHDNNTQWFTKIVSIDIKSVDEKNDGIEEFIDVDTAIKGPFIESIFERELHFSNKKFYGNSYYGWTISKNEFDRLKRLTELYPKYLEYMKKI
jgi:hypothetical protein